MSCVSRADGAKHLRGHTIERIMGHVGVDIQAVPLHMTMMIAGGEEAYYG
jgi:hypothetical protein